MERWYLQPQYKLRDHLPLDSDPDQYRYNPDEPTPSVGGPTLEATPFSVDNAELEARRDVIPYTSDPLTRDHDLIGALVAELFVSSSTRSADFFVRLCDIDAHGTSRISAIVCSAHTSTRPAYRRGCVLIYGRQLIGLRKDIVFAFKYRVEHSPDGHEIWVEWSLWLRRPHCT
jgi:predicted acyl esterase